MKENTILKQTIHNNLQICEEEKEALSRDFTDKFFGFNQEKENLNEVQFYKILSYYLISRKANKKLDSELKNTKKMFEQSVLNHKVLCHLLKKLKYTVEFNKKEISNLIRENQKLKIRAGFDDGELTPRPSFENVNNFEFLCLKKI